VRSYDDPLPKHAGRGSAKHSKKKGARTVQD
jgi:hypothetical protein